jgi:hypothetical protein
MVSFAHGAKVTAADAEAREPELYEQIGRLKMELERMEKKLPSSAERKRPLIDVGHPELSVRRQCELLGLNRSSLYDSPTSDLRVSPGTLRCVEKRGGDLTSRRSWDLVDPAASEIRDDLDIRLPRTADGRGHEALRRHSAVGGFFLARGGVSLTVVNRGNPGRSGAPPGERVLSGGPGQRARDDRDASRRGADPGPGELSPGTVARTQFGDKALPA